MRTRNFAERPVVLRAPNRFKRCREITWGAKRSYLFAKLDQALL